MKLLVESVNWKFDALSFKSIIIVFNTRALSYLLGVFSVQISKQVNLACYLPMLTHARILQYFHANKFWFNDEKNYNIIPCPLLFSGIPVKFLRRGLIHEKTIF